MISYLHRNYKLYICVYLVPFSRCSELFNYLSKVTDVTLPHLHFSPLLGVTPLEFRQDTFGVRKQSLRYHMALVAVLTQYRRVTDTKTSHMARCITFAVAGFTYFSLWHRMYGRQGIQKGLHWSEDRYVPADQIWL